MDFAQLVALNIHDLKNRLAMVAARAERRGDTATLHDILDVTADLSRLLACFKAEAGQLQPAIDAYCPAQLLQELVVDVPHASGPQLAIDTRRAPEMGYYDEGLVRMVLANALQNALRFARTKVDISAIEDGPWLEFCIRDDGPGYPDERLQGPQTASPLSRDGTGVGLYLAHEVAALHKNRGLQGEVRLENDHGAMFRLRLPM